jgi:hypothetical protein
MYSPSARARLIECLLIFLVLPAAIVWTRPTSAIFIILWLLAALCMETLKHYHGGWHLKEDWNLAGFDRAAFRLIVWRFVPFALGLVWLTCALMPAELFRLPAERPLLWLLVMILYPPLSILPQEIIYRSFFMRRYTPLLRDPARVRIACALAFGWMHIIMLNWVAIVLATIGGILFADTYQRTKSLAAVCFEHALYGCFVFSVGLGYFFYHGHALVR